MAFRFRRRFKFTEKTQSKKGIAASIVAFVLLVIYIVFIALAYQAKGTLSAYFGSVGVLAILVTIYNFVIVIQGMKEENSFQFFPRLALGLTILESIFWIGTYIIGFF